jgi:ankyrin repeat protein
MFAKTFGPANTTPLISSATRGHAEVVKLLLEQDDFGLGEMAKDNGKNALHFAARQGHTEIVNALLEKDPQLARRNDKKGQTALHMAVKGTNCDVLRELVDADPAIVMLPDKNGNTALHVATRKKRAEVFIVFPLLHFYLYYVYPTCYGHLSSILKKQHANISTSTWDILVFR